jgi:2-oxoglutarate-Fe(II)-dependent oxygenase superfamily protein
VASSVDVVASLDEDPTVERVDLGSGSWVDVVRGWVHGADELYAALTTSVDWRQGRVFRYERFIDEPRVGSWFGHGRPYPHHVFGDAERWMSKRYRVPFDGFGLAWYRDGHDSVAFHRDDDLRHTENTIVAILSLGARRPWLMQPRGNRDRFRDGHGSKAVDFRPGHGDLLVLGGRCQAEWLHAVPKVPQLGRAGGRISAQWRWTSGTGRPEMQPGYNKPRHFSRRSSLDAR